MTTENPWPLMIEQEVEVSYHGVHPRPTILRGVLVAVAGSVILLRLPTGLLIGISEYNLISVEQLPPMPPSEMMP